MTDELHINLMRERERAFCHPAATVPVEQVKEWWDRINDLRREINAAGLGFEAVIYNPPVGGGPIEPAVLYGKPLAVTNAQQVIENLAKAARDPSKVVRVDIRVHSGTRTVVEVEVVTP